MIVDDHPLVRRGLCDLFNEDAGFEVVVAVGGGEEALDAVQTQQPDVVLMDISMPGVDGIEATRRLLTVRPETRVVMLTSFADHERIMESLDSGAVGYILKDAESDELFRGVRAAASSAGAWPSARRRSRRI
jgi:DNA-binding NarL/FixJ family response regulator